MRAIVLSVLLCLQVLPDTSAQAKQSGEDQVNGKEEKKDRPKEDKGNPETASSRSNNNPKAEQPGPEKAYRWEKAYAPETVATWALVLVAIAASVIAIWTLWAIKDQVQIARSDLETTRVVAEIAKRSADTATQALRLTERADVLFENVGIRTDTIGHPEHSVMTMGFRNFGRTRADQVYAGFTMKAPDQEPMTATPFGPTVTGSGDTLILTFAPLSEYATERTFKRMWEGEICLALEGEVTYHDVFGAPHRTACVASFWFKRTPQFSIERKEAT